MNIDRRKFFTRLSWTGSALAIAGPGLSSATFDSTRQRVLEELENLKEALQQIDQERIKAELEDLKEAYESLDSRSKWTLRVLLAMGGLDILLTLE